MKKLRYLKVKVIILLTVLLGAMSLQAQEDESRDVLNPFKNSPLQRYDIVMLDVFYSGWDRPYQHRKPEWPSLGLGVSYMLDMPFKNRKVGLGLGLKYTWSTLKTDGQFVKDSTGQFSFNDINDNIKNTVHRHLFSIPFELRLRFPLKHDNLLKIYTGFEAGWQFRTTQVSKVDNDKSKDILKDVLSDWQYGPYIRIGFNDIFLFGRLELNSYLMNQNQNLHVFQLGVSFGG